jgi:hypothetical protein
LPAVGEEEAEGGRNRRGEKETRMNVDEVDQEGGRITTAGGVSQQQYQIQPSERLRSGGQGRGGSKQALPAGGAVEDEGAQRKQRGEGEGGQDAGVDREESAEGGAEQSLEIDLLRRIRGLREALKKEKEEKENVLNDLVRGRASSFFLDRSAEGKE